jgi:proteasome lid subunit RPN8/RPN11
VPQAIREQLKAHARDEAPNECCGMIASRDGEAVAVHRARNAAASPLRYIIDPQEQYRITQEIEDAGLELGLIYHSHTRSDPVPSQTDINFGVNWPGVEWIIVGLKNGDAPDVRSWLIEGASVSEVPIE